MRGIAILACLIIATVGASTAGAQTPAVAPAPGYVLHQQTTADRFVVQRWVSEASPGVSPAGFCECITVVYEEGRLVLRLETSGVTTVSAIGDVTGDRRAELMVSIYSGGAHCCYSTAIYSVADATPRPLVSLDTRDCAVEVVDLDRNGVAELRTCEPAFGYVFCAFAYSPFPPVVYAYDRGRGEFVPATPRFSRHLQLPTASAARATVAASTHAPDVARCAALAPALGLIYTGRVQQGQQLFRQLYREPDAAEVAEKALAIATQSAMWIPR